jgi:hypothetical protein
VSRADAAPQSSARFEVREVLRFTARRKIVLAGRILDGIARAGQTINFRLPDGLTWSAKIAAVEFVDRMFSEPLIGLRATSGIPGRLRFTPNSVLRALSLNLLMLPPENRRRSP